MQNLKSPRLWLLVVVGLASASGCSLPLPKGLSGDGGNVLSTTCSLSPDAGVNIVRTVEVTGDAENVIPVQTACAGPTAGSADAGVNPNAIDIYSQGYGFNDPSILAKVDKTMQNISLADETAQLYGMPYLINGGVQFNDIQRSQDTTTIRGYRYRDASRGINLGEDLDGVFATADFVNGQHVGYSTAFPVSMARGAAFDLDLEAAIGEAIGDEMQATGQTLLLAPCMNLLRHPLWGRAQETYGEDSYQIGRLASALVVGVQQHVEANAKHYMGYDIENHRALNDSEMEDEQTLRETYGRHFRMVVQDSGVGSVMASYNLVDGVKSTENSHTLTDVLRNDFGFKGFILSDWWAMPGDTSIPDTSTLNSNAIKALNAGLDVELPWGLYYGQLQSLQQTGAINQSQIDASARRVLYEKFRFNADPLTGLTGLGKPVTVYTNSRISCDYTHLALATQAARESMVLLKNDMGALPISPAVKKVAVVGATVPYVTNNGSPDQPTGGTVDFATDVRTGDLGSSRVFPDPDPKKSVGPFAGIQAAAPSGVTVVSGTTVADVPSDADFVVVVAGLTPQDEGEEYTGAGDRTNLSLDGKQTDPKYMGIQNQLIASVAALGKPMVVVLEGGAVIDVTPWIGSLPASSAVVMAWYPGQRGGEALGDLLWGQVNGVSYNFGGKLPITWGNLGDYDVFNGAGDSASGGKTTFHYYAGYRWFDNKKIALTPAQGTYPFGYGLSYTSFQYSDLQLGCSTLAPGAVLPVVVNITNTGTVAGDEIAMVFVTFPNTTVPKRVGQKELKGFARVSLAAGETKQVTIPVRLSDLDYFQDDATDPMGGHWAVESGPIKIMVGGSSTNLPLTGTVNVPNAFTVGSTQ
ncbi:MAG TPA: glycoside hydrolase family 3 N-terminal domain-containing protein [Polyangia bacterium]|nr:glycoside hydrolase family 3 N-terminal domain-containing protein [Polyangia bacterium]